MAEAHGNDLIRHQQAAVLAPMSGPRPADTTPRSSASSSKITCST
jgi:hypothetical protein